MSIWQGEPCPTCGGSGVLPQAASLSERLAYLRRKSGFTLREVEAQALAMGASLSNAAVSQMETGATVNPSLKHIAALAKIYGVTLDELIEGIAL